MPFEEQQQMEPTTESRETTLKIITQVEYYFGDFNLPRDRFLRQQIRLDNGWIPMTTMVKFKRLAEISTDFNVIMNALRYSQLMEVDEFSQKIRRSCNPLPVPEEHLKGKILNRTVYCAGFPKDPSVNMDKLLKNFDQYRPFESIKMRRYYDNTVKKYGFKGSILIVFPTVEVAENFMKIDEIMYEEKPILRRWHQDYLNDKKHEIVERIEKLKLMKKEKEEGKGATAELPDPPPIPRGSFLFATGFTKKTRREDIKSSLMEYTNDVAFIDSRRGQTDGYIRLSTPFSNKQLLERIDGKLKVNGNDITVRLVEGEEEAELINKVEDARSKAKYQPKKKTTVNKKTVNKKRWMKRMGKY